MNKNLILSVGMPRAGTGWFHNITKTLVIAAGGIEATKIRKKYHLSRLLTEVNCNIGTISSYRILPVLVPLILEPNYVIKLHGGRRPLADKLIASGLIKTTYIYRDPRDAALSIYEYGQEALTNPTSSNDFAHIRTIEAAVEYISPYINIARGWISSSQTFSIKYEDLFYNFDGIILDLIDFLNINIDSKNAINLIAHLKPGMNIEKRKFTHFKKGKIGRYKEHFSEDQINECDRLFGDFLADNDYL